MQMIRRSIFLAIMMCLAGTADARTSVPIVNLENNAIVTSSGKEPALDAVAQAIKAAGASQVYNWTASGESPGVLQLSTLVRGKHTVVVNVTFDTRTYSIRYSSSINMNYKAKDGKEIIHPFYNTWTQDLKQGIDAELKKL
jgi:hypothetical protein